MLQNPMIVEREKDFTDLRVYKCSAEKYQDKKSENK